MSVDEIDPKIHLLDLDGKFVHHGTLCQGAIKGDRAISIRDALNSELNLRFNCKECLEVMTREIFKADI